MPCLIERKPNGIMQSFLHNCVAHPLWFGAEIAAVGLKVASINARRVADRLADLHDHTAR